jgi:hypothetical protein
MIEIYDNFLPQQDFERIKDIMLGGDFPWFYSKTKVKSVDPENHNNYQFTHMMYDNYVPRSQFWSTLDPIIRRINAQAWLRTKCNLTPRTEDPYSYGFHVDIDDFHGKTAVFYVNNNNGQTVFQVGEDVILERSKENRLVIFDSQIEHTGTSCTDAKVRCVINFNFLPNPNMNLSEDDVCRIKMLEI